MEVLGFTEDWQFSKYSPLPSRMDELRTQVHHENYYVSGDFCHCHLPIYSYIIWHIIQMCMTVIILNIWSYICISFVTYSADDGQRLLPEMPMLSPGLPLLAALGS